MGKHELYAEICKLAFLDFSEEKIKSLGNFDEVHFIENFETSTELYVAVNESTIIVAFRASENFYDWVETNMKIGRVKGLLGPVHFGFQRAFLSIQNQLEEIISDYSDRAVVLTGHSLGGAISIVAACHVDFDECVCFGSPRVYTRASAKAYNKLYRNRTIRYTMSGDFITRVPSALFGNRHIDHSLYFNRHGNLMINPDIKYVAKESIMDFFSEILEGSLFEFEDHALDLYISHIQQNEKQFKVVENLMVKSGIFLTPDDKYA